VFETEEERDHVREVCNRRCCCARKSDPNISEANFTMPTVGGHMKLVAGEVSEFSNGTLSS
jgi:hypothetical protein